MWKDWLSPALAAAIAIVIALLAHWVTFSALSRLAAGTRRVVDDALVRRSRRPARLILPVLAVLFILPNTALPHDWTAVVDHVLALALIAAMAWMLIALLAVFEDAVKRSVAATACKRAGGAPGRRYFTAPACCWWCW